MELGAGNLGEENIVLPIDEVGGVTTAGLEASPGQY